MKKLLALGIFFVAGLNIAESKTCLELFNEEPPYTAVLSDKVVEIGDHDLELSLEKACKDAVRRYVCINMRTEDIAETIRSLHFVSIEGERGFGYCRLESDLGVFQVVRSSMAINPTIVVLYSHWD